VGDAEASDRNPGQIRKGASVEPISKHEQHARSGEPPRRRLPPARTSAEWRVLRARSGKELPRRRVPLFAVVAVALSVLATAACGGAERGGVSAADAKAGQEAGGQESAPAARTTASAGPEGDERDKADARAGDAVARADGGAAVGNAKARAGEAGARAGEAKAGTGGAAIAGKSRGDTGGSTEREDGPQKVTLEITGDPGTGFSGACSVGGTERTLDGRVPERYVFEPQGKSLECELRTEGGGALGIVFTDGAGVISEQRTAGGERTVKFAYSNGGISSSSSSVSRGQTVTYSDRSSSEGSQ